MLQDNKLFIFLLLALFCTLSMQAYEGTIEEVSFKYEEYKSSSYAPIVKEIIYKYNGSTYLLEDKEGLYGTALFPSYIEKNIIDNFVDTLTVRRKNSNTVFFTIQDVNNCLLFIHDGHHTDIPMLLSSYDISDTFLMNNMPMLCSMNSIDMQILLDIFYKNTNKPSCGITFKSKNGKNIEVHPNSVYEGDSWCLNKNSYINYQCVTNFLSQINLQNLFVPIEKEYMMIHLIGIYKKYKFI